MDWQAVYNMRWHDTINSIHIVQKFLSLQVEIKYLCNTQRLTSIWPLSLFCRTNAHSVILHTCSIHSSFMHTLYTVGQILFLAAFFANHWRSIDVEMIHKQWKQRYVLFFFFFFLGKGFWDYKHEFQQNLGYATMTFQEDLKNGSTSSCHMLSAMNIWFQWDLTVGYSVMQKCVKWLLLRERFGHRPFILGVICTVKLQSVHYTSGNN